MTAHGEAQLSATQHHAFATRVQRAWHWQSYSAAQQRAILERVKALVAERLSGEALERGVSMKHTWLQHTNCKSPYCPICVGGLGQCTICGGAECELPRECPGAPMTEEQKRRVCDGILDFRGGVWEMLPGRPPVEWLI